MLLGLVGGGPRVGVGTAGPGFTIIQSVSGSIAATEYEVVSSTQTALSVSINFAGSNRPWLMFGDAVQAAPTPPPPIPEYPLGLPILAIFMILAYGVIRHRTGKLKTT
jgi:hypothetical protein